MELINQRKTGSQPQEKQKQKQKEKYEKQTEPILDLAPGLLGLGRVIIKLFRQIVRITTRCFYQSSA